MPEIPEIETVRRQLIHYTSGKRIIGIDVQREKTLNVPTGELVHELSDATITTVLRRGKILILRFNHPVSLVFHFMLEGYLKFLRPEETWDKDYQLLLRFATGERLYFCKMFLGYIHLEHTIDINTIPEVMELGADPLAPEFSYERFHEMLTSRKKMVKPLLMDQNFLAGIGNTYSNEGLFLGGILPGRKAGSLKAEETRKLYESLRDLLQRSIVKGGVGDIPVASDDTLTGGFTPELQVSYRENEPCFVCGTPISFEKIGGRNAFYCKVCQV